MTQMPRRFMPSALAIAASLVVHTAIAGAASAQAPRYGRIQGVVFDSVSMSALGGATVQLVSVADPSRARSTTADGLGRFRYDSVAVGSWILNAVHPRLDSLGVREIMAPVTVGERGATRATITVPSARTLADRVCGSTDSATDSSGFLFGSLRSAREGRAAVRGTVRVQWLELLYENGTWQRDVATIDASSGPDGSFLACGVPVRGIIRLKAWSGTDSSGVVEFTLPEHGIYKHDLFVGESRLLRTAEAPPPSSDSLAATDSIVNTVWRGSGQLRGVVRGLNAKPLANARVTVRATGVEARTDDQGAFTLNGLPTGTWTLDLRALGFEPELRPVDIFPSDSAVPQFAMQRLLMLDTMKVRADRIRRLGSGMAGFEDRRRAGLGRFFTPEDIEKIQPTQFTDLMRRVPGVQVMLAGSSGYIATMRGMGFNPRCRPTIFVDRMRMPNDETINSFLPTAWIKAVEVYQAGFAPAEFMNALSGCGSIVVWTGERPTSGTTAPSK